MASKDPRVEVRTAHAEAGMNLSKIERFLRLLTWQMFFLLAILLYLALRPQAGRYEFVTEKEGRLVVVDTGWPSATTYELPRQKVITNEETEPETPPAQGESE